MRQPLGGEDKPILRRQVLCYQLALMATLKAENGKILEVKEGTVLDKDGTLLAGPDPKTEHSRFGSRRFRSFNLKITRLNPPLAIVLAALAPFLLVAVIAIVMMVGVFFILAWLIGGLLRIAGLSRNPDHFVFPSS
jgi:hypothetical protein